MVAVLNLIDLPTDPFLLVTSFLSPIDIIFCRLVSKSWHKEFVDDSFLRDILVREFPVAREVRNLLARELAVPENRHEGSRGESRNIWQVNFDRVVARYCALRNGKPLQVTKKRLSRLTPYREDPLWIPWKSGKDQNYHFKVGRWDRHLSSMYPAQVEARSLPTDLPESEWTYDSGLLIYADAEVNAYVVLDIEANTTSIVPFETDHRVVRRIRLKENVLVIEWAESQPYHKLNDTEQVYRHFVTAFDVLPRKDFPWLPRWDVTFRNEWKLHYLGFPLSWRDCWLSSHSATHYAVYIWQPNRSAWGEDEPIEALNVWDFTQSSRYRPSKDPSARCQPSKGPHLVKKLSYTDLDYLTIRQRDTPVLRKIEVDGSACVYFFEEGCVLECGQHVADQRWNQVLGKYWERIIGIPVLGPGPRWEDRCDDQREDTQDTLSRSIQIISAETQQRSPKRANCWRYAGIYPGVRNEVIKDESAGLDFTAEHDTGGVFRVQIKSHVESWATKLDLKDFDPQPRSFNGDERWLITQRGDALYILRFDKGFKINER